MEEVAAALDGWGHWYQLYWSRDDDLVESLVHRAEACGSEAIVVTLDTAYLGWRPRDLDLGTCRSPGARASRSTPPTPCSAGSSRSASPPQARPGGAGADSPGPRRPPCALGCR